LTRLARRRDVALVTDGFVRKGVAAVRSLGRRGVRVVACEATALAPGLTSRYAWRRVVHPPLALDREGFLDAIEAACRRLRPRVILAMEEETILALLERRARFEALGARLPYAAPEMILGFSDKLATLERARSLGIEVPRTWTDPARAAAEAEFPVIAKPRRGSGAWGVRYLNSSEELRRLQTAGGIASHPCPRNRSPGELNGAIVPHWGSDVPESDVGVKSGILIQDRLTGPGIGVSLLYDSAGRLRAQFAHRRLREWPSTGGASTLRESARFPEVEALSRRLLESAGFVGPAMVEWKIDARDGRPKLLEVNPRFWGSLALAVRAGIDFPWLLYRSAIGEEFPAVTEYPTGVRARWFLPGDFMHFVERRDWRGLARSLWPGGEPRAPDDVFAPDDLGAALGAVLFSIPFALRPEWRRFRRLARA
jgi:predicted ATP-grasp superfamily ATP-dependent carboligase